MRYRNRSVPATGWRDKRIIGSMNDERRHGYGRQTRATVALRRQGRGRAVFPPARGDDGLVVKQTALAGNAACENSAMREEAVLVRDGIGRGRIIIAMTSGAACGSAGLPEPDMIDVRDRTRAGCSLATICAIIPPIDRPTTCAWSIESMSSKPMASRAMSSSV